MKKFGLSYPDAIREVARRGGILVPEGDTRTEDPREPIYSAVAVAHDWFSRRLFEEREAAIARQYLEKRGIDVNHAAQIGLGFAPSGKAFIGAMKELGLSDETLQQAGLLVVRDDGTHAARFRGRLLFPIHDLRGRVVGFGGRLLVEGEPKYLNSPETPIFRKGGLLYNLHAAKHAIRSEGHAILVEGYFDVIQLVLAGVDNVVAGLGTSFTADQAILLRRFTNEATLLYDSDAAGLKATFRTGDELLRTGIRVSVASLPDGEDPDSIVRKGGVAALRPLLRDAVDLLERKLDLLARNGWLDNVQRRRAALDKLLPTVRAVPDPITRDLYLSTIADRVRVSRQALEQELKTEAVVVGTSTAVSRTNQESATRDPWQHPSARAERDLLVALLRSEDWSERARDEVRLEWFQMDPLRELFIALPKIRSAVSPLDAIESLTKEAHAAYLWLMNREVFEGQPLDDMYVDSCERLETRPLGDKFYQVRHDLEVESDFERKCSLHVELVSIGEAFAAKYPLQWKRVCIKKPQIRKQLSESKQLVTRFSKQHERMA